MKSVAGRQVLTHLKCIFGEHSVSVEVQLGLDPGVYIHITWPVHKCEGGVHCQPPTRINYFLFGED